MITNIDEYMFFKIKADEDIMLKETGVWIKIDHDDLSTYPEESGHYTTVSLSGLERVTIFSKAYTMFFTSKVTHWLKTEC